MIVFLEDTVLVGRFSRIREDAPESIRVGLREVLAKIGFDRPSSQRLVICQALRARPDPGNWSEYPNINQEVDMASFTA